MNPSARAPALALLAMLMPLGGCTPSRAAVEPPRTGDEGMPEAYEGGHRLHDICGLRFSLPAAVLVTSGSALAEDGAACRIVASTSPAPEEGLESDPNTPVLWIDISDVSFEEAAERAGFERTADGWVVRGRHGMETAADTISRGGWTGVHGMAQVGRFDREGYTGLEDSPRAVLWDGTARSVIVEATVAAEGWYGEILSTLRFTR